MVTFNFEGVATGDAGGVYVTVKFFCWPNTSTSLPGWTPSASNCISGFDTTRTGNNPIIFTSAQTGAGLAGNTMTFAVTADSSWLYRMRADPDTDSLFVANGAYYTYQGRASFTMSFTDGSGLNALVDPVASFGQLRAGDAFWLTPAGGTAPVQNGVAHAGTVTGMKFVTSYYVELTSLSGTLACFARGTRIATPEGQVAVQDLRIGDRLLTAEGGTCEVRWIGRQSFDTRMGIPERLRLVRIAAGALGGGLPLRDLVLTADHALLIDDTLVNAGALVDGGAIRWETPGRLGRHVTVYHVETGDHALILAEGAPAETFIDYLSRADFDNYAEYAAQDSGATITEQTRARVSAARLLWTRGVPVAGERSGGSGLNSLAHR